MAGVKGRSGGARPNSGPKKNLIQLAANSDDPLEFLLQVMQDEKAPAEMRVRSAMIAAQYMHSRKGEGGVKTGRKSAAAAASSGKFAPAAAPKLVVSNGQ